MIAGVYVAFPQLAAVDAGTNIAQAVTGVKLPKLGDISSENSGGYFEKLSTKERIRSTIFAAVDVGFMFLPKFLKKEPKTVKKSFTPDKTSTDVQNAGGEASPWTADLSVASGKAAKARNKAINAAIREDLPHLNLSSSPQYSPFAAQGVAKRNQGTQIGKKAFVSRDKLVDTIVHEELHLRWWRKGIQGNHHSPDTYVPNELFYNVLSRYKRLRKYYLGKK